MLRINCISNRLPFRALACSILILLCAFTTGFGQQGTVRKFTITIDAGHGGKDPGAPGRKSVEKNLALGIALKLGHYLESLMEDVNVFYTRKTDIFIPLYERAQIANRNNSDLFISIHVNGNKKSAPYGTSTYVMGFSKSADNLDLVMRENEAILLEQDYKTRYADFDPTSPESYIIFNNVQNNNLTQSLQLATTIQDQFRTRAKRKDTGVHQGNLVVLWGCAKPSVLVETGFISNPEEELFLMSENGQDIIASAIYNAIKDYKESVDGKTGVIAQVDKPAVKPAETRAQPPVVQTRAADSSQAEGAGKNKDTAASELRTETKVEMKEADQKPDTAAVNTVARPTGTETEYRVQIIASPRKLPEGARELKGFRDFEVMETGGYFKYLTRPVRDYQEALELKRKLGATFKGAFVVAFRNGERVALPSGVEGGNR